MRRLSILLALIACSDNPGGPIPVIDEPELPRGEHHLLVESISRAGRRSWYTMTPAGSFHSAFPAPDDAVRLIPAPDGKTIAYLRFFDDLIHLWIMDRDGDSRRKVLDGEVLVDHAAWSPDGKKFVLEISTLESASDIATINADGTGFTLLAEDGPNFAVFDRNPDWSPDGTRIVFTSNRTSLVRLWIMNANGSNPVQLLPDTELLPRAPRWSPDGSLIAFEAVTPQGRGVGVVRPNGQDFRFIPVAGDVARLSWLPDGRLLYSSHKSRDVEIFARDLVTDVETNLTRHTDHDMRAEVLRWNAPATWLGFGVPTVHESGAENPTGVAVGEVNGDGFADVVVPSPIHASLRLLLGTASGFAPFGTLDAIADLSDIRIADVTGDGEADIAVLSGGGGGFHIWKGGAGGPFLPSFHGIEGTAHSFLVGDSHRDGPANVMMSFTPPANPGNPPNPFHLGIWGVNSDGNVIALVDAPTTFTSPGRACLGDVTGEGNPDVVIIAGVPPQTAVVLMKGQGAGGFESIQSATGFLGQDAADIPVCADFDGDRKTDLALLRPGGLVVTRSVGNAFGAIVGMTLSGDALGAADFDKDGDVDIVVASAASKCLYFLRNLGDADFASPKCTALQHAPRHLAVADANGDGWPDVVMATSEGTVLVARNQRRVGGAM